MLLPHSPNTPQGTLFNSTNQSNNKMHDKLHAFQRLIQQLYKISPVRIKTADVFCNILVYQLAMYISRKEKVSLREKTSITKNLYPSDPHIVPRLYQYNKKQNCPSSQETIRYTRKARIRNCKIKKLICFHSPMVATSSVLY